MSSWNPFVPVTTHGCPNTVDIPLLVLEIGWRVNSRVQIIDKEGNETKRDIPLMVKSRVLFGCYTVGVYRITLLGTQCLLFLS